MLPNEEYPIIQLVKIISPQLVDDFPEIEHDLQFDKKDRKQSVKKTLEELIDKINNKKGNLSINFFPSKTDGACHEILLGIATKKFGHNCDKAKLRTGFEGLIKNIIICWLRCYEVNKSTTIITMDWDEPNFARDWLEIIESYKSKGKKIRIFQISEMNKTFKLIYS